MNRRDFIFQTSAIAGLAVCDTLVQAKSSDNEPFQVHQWQRDEANPVFPLGTDWFDVDTCMNPFVVVHEGEYLLFYGGGDAQGNRRICLATTPISDLFNWKRHGPIVDLGAKGSFDEFWCVLPCVHRIGNKWHLYYTGRSKGDGGLQSFRGIGLATSDDLFHWKKWSDEPVLRGDGFSEWPDNHGIAGGGSLVALPQSDGRILYRMYYTLATGTPSEDLLVDQAKQSVVAHSYDGINWNDKQVVLRPRLDAKYENAAAIGLTVWKTSKGWRGIYAGIGTQFGAYSICEATSKDGLTWNRGKPGENLSIPPGEAAWENQMTEYPNVVPEGDKLRLFYCGNGYGRTGIGTAIARPLK